MIQFDPIWSNLIILSCFNQIINVMQFEVSWSNFIWFEFSKVRQDNKHDKWLEASARLLKLKKEIGHSGLNSSRKRVVLVWVCSEYTHSTAVIVLSAFLPSLPCPPSHSGSLLGIFAQKVFQKNLNFRYQKLKKSAIIKPSLFHQLLKLK